MKSTTRRAMTLIEMLIVIAIMAIFAAGSIAYITAPPREQILAATDMENEAGLGRSFEKLVGDTHNATRVLFVRDRKMLILEQAAGNSDAIYFVDAKGELKRALTPQAMRPGATHREEPSPSFLLARNIRRFEATPDGHGNLWRISIGITSKDPLHPSLDRSVCLLAGASSIQSPMKKRAQ